MNTTTETQYLTDIKFRNAVKRTLANFRILGKNETHRRFSVRIQSATYKDDTLFSITYYGGDFSAADLALSKQLQLERQLVMAGFEMAPAVDNFGEPTVAWRMAA